MTLQGQWAELCVLLQHSVLRSSAARGTAHHNWLCCTALRAHSALQPLSARGCWAAAACNLGSLAAGYFFPTPFGSAFFQVCILLKSLFLWSEHVFFPMQKHSFVLFFLGRKKSDDIGKEPLYPLLIFSPFVQHFWSRSLTILSLLFGYWVPNECFTPDSESIPGPCLSMVWAFETMHDEEKEPLINKDTEATVLNTGKALPLFIRSIFKPSCYYLELHCSGSGKKYGCFACMTPLAYIVIPRGKNQDVPATSVPKASHTAVTHQPLQLHAPKCVLQAGTALLCSPAATATRPLINYSPNRTLPTEQTAARKYF